MTQRFRKRGMTLVELILALLLLGVVVMTGVSMELGLRRIYSTTDFESQLMSEALPIITMITKSAARGIGDLGNPPYNDNDSQPGWGSDYFFKIRMDTDGNGIADSTDHWVTYRWTGATGNPSDRYQIWYYSDNASNVYEVLSNRVFNFSIVPPAANSDGLFNLSIMLKRNCSDAYNLTNPNITVNSSVQFRSSSLS